MTIHSEGWKEHVNLRRFGVSAVPVTVRIRG